MLCGSCYYSEKIENQLEVGKKNLRHFYLSILKVKCQVFTGVEYTQWHISSVDNKRQQREALKRYIGKL